MCFNIGFIKLNHSKNKKSLEKVKTRVTKTGIPSITTSPHESLQRGNWVKLICGASFEVRYIYPLSIIPSLGYLYLTLSTNPLTHFSLFLQDVVDVRNLSLVYTLAGGEFFFILLSSKYIIIYACIQLFLIMSIYVYGIPTITRTKPTLIMCWVTPIISFTIAIAVILVEIWN